MAKTSNHEIHGCVVLVVVAEGKRYNRGKAKESVLGREEFRSTNINHQPHFKDGEARGSEKLSNFPNSTWGLLAEVKLKSGPGLLYQGTLLYPHSVRSLKRVGDPERSQKKWAGRQV